jgi:Ca-activated chloride channel homolog
MMSLHSFRFYLALMAVVGIAMGIHSQSANAEQIKLNAALAKPTMLAGEKGLNYLKVKLTGFELPKASVRPPVNIAIVMDRSGSMKGEKIQQAKRAALAAIDRLRDDDIVSVVTYDTNVRVLVPATKASDRDAMRQAIEGIQADGNTALFAGVAKGAAEVRKFLDDKHVNRIILLSDGLANVGPSSPTELEQLGQSLLKEKISVSTLGLGTGYNEDLMTSLAAASSGNHVFIENADNLVAVFNNEFDDLLSVVASEFDIQITLASSMRPVRSLGNNADIHGQVVRIPLAQLYARQERYFILEVEVPAGENGMESTFADVRVQYRNLNTHTTDQIASKIAVRFSNNPEKVESDVDVEAKVLSAVQIAAERNREATALRDAGRIDEAKTLLLKNALDLDLIAGFSLKNNFLCPDVELGCTLNKVQSAEVADESKWLKNRKVMREYQDNTSRQQTFNESGKRK